MCTLRGTDVVRILDHEFAVPEPISATLALTGLAALSYTTKRRRVG